MRKTIEIPLRWQGKELTLRLGGIDDDDITFFNGEEVVHSEGWNVQREYNVPAGLVKSGKGRYCCAYIGYGFIWRFLWRPCYFTIDVEKQ